MSEQQLQQRLSALEAFLTDILNNAPKDEPTNLEPRTLPQAWAFWVAGEKARTLKKWLDEGEGK